MWELATVLVVTNLITLSLLLVRRRAGSTSREPQDKVFTAAFAAGVRTSPTPGERARRFISIEILNPIELAGTRNRVFAIAGSLVPDLTRRLVYDQTVKILRKQLVQHEVVAEVRVLTSHTVPAGDQGDRTVVSVSAQPPGVPRPADAVAADGVEDDVVVAIEIAADSGHGHAAHAALEKPGTP